MQRGVLDVVARQGRVSNDYGHRSIAALVTLSHKPPTSIPDRSTYVSVGSRCSDQFSAYSAYISGITVSPPRVQPAIPQLTVRTVPSRLIFRLGLNP
jgi:hypothetical protein